MVPGQRMYLTEGLVTFAVGDDTTFAVSFYLHPNEREAISKPCLSLSWSTLMCFCREKEAHNGLGAFLPAQTPQGVCATEQGGSCCKTSLCESAPSAAAIAVH